MEAIMEIYRIKPLTDYCKQELGLEETYAVGFKPLNKDDVIPSVFAEMKDGRSWLLEPSEYEVIKEYHIDRPEDFYGTSTVMQLSQPKTDVDPASDSKYKDIIFLQTALGLLNLQIKSIEFK